MNSESSDASLATRKMICDSAQMLEVSRFGEVQAKLNVERCRRIIENSRRFLEQTARDTPSASVDSRQSLEKAERPKDRAVLPRPRPPLQSTPKSSGWVSLPRTYPGPE
jgi:hypothetical protein